MLNILVADDNPISLDFLAAALQQLGHDFTAVRDGREAVAAAERQGYDLILLDDCMPGLDGPAALAGIRAGAGSSRAAPALATTAGTERQRHGHLIDAGFATVLTKPIGVAGLDEAIRKYALPDGGMRMAPFDDRRALAAVGGDMQIVAALRGLLMTELERLPAELATLAHHADHGRLAERMHRLRASAGFCGVPTLEQRAIRLESLALAQAPWPVADIAALASDCAVIAAQLRALPAG